MAERIEETAIPRAFLLDFDGVIVDSVDVKSAAFADIYAGEDPGVVARIVAYQLHHGGVSRRSKFQHFETVMLARDADEARLDDLCRRFSDLVVAKVIAAPLLPGALDFLEAAQGACDLFLVSGTPEVELRHIVRERGLEGYFVAVHGSPRTKVDLFRTILAERGCAAHQAVAVGDSITECDAALSLGIPFVGVTSPHDAGFPPEVPKIADMGGLSRLYGLV